MWDPLGMVNNGVIVVGNHHQASHHFVHPVTSTPCVRGFGLFTKVPRPTSIFLRRTPWPVTFWPAWWRKKPTAPNVLGQKRAVQWLWTEKETKSFKIASALWQKKGTWSLHKRDKSKKFLLKLLLLIWVWLIFRLILRPKTRSQGCRFVTAYNTKKAPCNLVGFFVIHLSESRSDLGRSLWPGAGNSRLETLSTRTTLNLNLKESS